MTTIKAQDENTLPAWLSPDRDGGSRLRLHVQPRAARSECVGLHGDALKLRLNAPPVDGKANRELIAHLAQRLGIAASSIVVLRGTRSRDKLVGVALAPRMVLEKLA